MGVRAEGGTATTCACDITDDDSVKRAFDVAQHVGDVEVLVYNAAPGLPEGRDFWNMPAPHEVDPAYLQTAFDIGVAWQRKVRGLVTREVCTSFSWAVHVPGVCTAGRACWTRDPRWSDRISRDAGLWREGDTDEACASGRCILRSAPPKVNHVVV